MELTQTQLQALVASMSRWMQERLKDTGAKQALVGISGGKDSSVVAALCVQAFGKDRVIGLLMPDGTQSDIAFAQALCSHLDIRHDTFDIQAVTAPFYRLMSQSALLADGIQEQTRLNLPPRVRMTLLYAVAQSLDAAVVNTSNLSEDWVGYATIYGDTAGAFSPLAMLTTDEVVQIGRYLGLPEALYAKTPSDGLTGKTDEDVLGFSYETLNRYIREGKIDDSAVRKVIDRKHRISRFKFLTIPMFDPQLPIAAEDIANIY